MMINMLMHIIYRCISIRRKCTLQRDMYHQDINNIHIFNNLKKVVENDPQIPWDCYETQQLNFGGLEI